MKPVQFANMSLVHPLERLHAITSALAEAHSVEQVAAAIAQTAVPALDATFGLVCLLSEDEAEFQLIHSVGYTDSLITEWATFPASTPMAIPEAVRLGQPILLANWEERLCRYPDFAHISIPDCDGALAAIPLIHAGRAMGALGLSFRDDRVFSPEEQAFMLLIGQQCGLAMERARLYDQARRELQERTRAEERLLQSEARLAEAQRLAQIGSWEYHIATERIFWSAELFRLLEMDPAAGEPSVAELLSHYHPDDLPMHDEFVQKALKDGLPCQFDMRILRADGTIRWTQACGQGEMDSSGTVIRLFGTLLDIHARKTAEEQVQAYQIALEAQKVVLETANAGLAALATTDGLTGLLNHRTFHHRLEEETVRAQREKTTLAVVMLDLDSFKFFNDVYGHAVGDHVLQKVSERLQQVCRSYDILARFGGDEFAVLMPNVGVVAADTVERRLRAELRGITYSADAEATVIPITVSVGVALYPYSGQDRQEVLRQADKRLLRSKTGGSAETEADKVRLEMGRSLEGFSMLDALVTAVDNKDRYTRKHSEDVMEYSLMIARKLGMQEALLQTIGIAALLHDVGKIGVPDAILRKPGKLTEAEYRAVKQHPQLGAALVSTVPELNEMLDAVRHHHERWDGKGYPAGLKEKETPLIARLMAVADAFSAMTTDRPYRQGMERKKAIFILSEGAGSQWDPTCVGAFLRALPVHFRETPID